MKTATFEKKRNAFASILLAGIISVSGFAATTFSASATKISSPTIEEQIFDVCQYQYTIEGIELTAAEKNVILNEISDAIRDYSVTNDCTYSTAGESLLSEMIMETGYGTQSNDSITPYSSGKGHTKLPASSKGYEKLNVYDPQTGFAQYNVKFDSTGTLTPNNLFDSDSQGGPTLGDRSPIRICDNGDLYTAHAYSDGTIKIHKFNFSEQRFELYWSSASGILDKLDKQSLEFVSFEFIN